MDNTKSVESSFSNTVLNGGLCCSKADLPQQGSCQSTSTALKPSWTRFCSADSGCSLSSRAKPTGLCVQYVQSKHWNTLVCLL